jgi:glycosyltransferase involved in cell wall biosynthesis
VVIPPGRPELVAAAIRHAHENRDELEEMGARGRSYVVREADKHVAVDRYRRLLQEVAG